MGCGASQSVAAEAVDGHRHRSQHNDDGTKGTVARSQISPRDRTAVVIADAPQLRTSYKLKQPTVQTGSGVPVTVQGSEPLSVAAEGPDGLPLGRGVDVHSQQHTSSLRNSSSTDPTPPNSGHRLRVGLVAMDSSVAANSVSSTRQHHAAVSPATLNLARLDSSTPVSPMNNVCSEGDHSLQEHTIGSPMGGSATNLHRPMFQVNSFAASKSFRRQQSYGGGAGAVGMGEGPVVSASAQQAMLAPRVRNRSLARSQLVMQQDSGSFGSVASDGSCTRVPSIAVQPSSVVFAGDLRSGRVSREERLSVNPLRLTYLASELAPQKVYYVFKALHTQFLLSVVPGEPTTPLTPSESQDQSPRKAQRQDILADLPTVPPERRVDPAIRDLDGRVALSMTLLQKMGHKNMQSVYSVMTVGDHVLALGEFFFKSNIADEEIFDDAKVCMLTKEVIRVLHYTHSHHIPHGHLTLGNIYVKDNSIDFAISDFGMAHLFLSMDLDELYGIGYTDPALHPPERIEALHRNRQALHVGGEDANDDANADDVATLRGDDSHVNSPRTQKQNDMENLDLWALGCCIFEKRFGRRAFHGDSMDELHERILTDSPEFPPWCDNNLYHLLTRLLSKDPANRGPFHAVLREPFIRHRVDVSRSVLGSSGGSSLAHSNHDEVEIGASAKRQKSVLWRRGSSIAAAAAAAAATTPMAQDPPPFYFVDDQVWCSNCRQLCKVVCYQCMVCPGFRVCRSCQYQNNFEHDAGHELEALAMDTTVPLDATSPMDCATDPAASPSSRPNVGRTGHRGTLLISTSQLTDREATIFAMTGTLPMCLEVERTARCTTQRPDAHKQIQLMGMDSGSTPPCHPLTGSDAIQPTAPSGGGGAPTLSRQLMTEAAACGEEDSPESVIEVNGQRCAPELLLSNFDLVEVPPSILDPPFAHVTVLDLANNCLCVVPESIEYLVNLRRVLLGNNKLTALPESIGNLTDLEHLDVNHNQLSTLPQSLMFCDQMEVLALDYNAFAELPLVLADVEVRTVFLAANPGIERWPSLDVMQSFPRGMTIGLDNDPSLFREATCSPLAQLLADRQIHVAWNKIYPDFVLPGVFLGSLRSAQSLEVYAKVGITHVLTMGRGLDALPPPGGHHKIVVVDDLPGASIDFAFEDAVAFIDDAVTAGGGVLVHCFAGMSRSATTVIAYLMMRRGMRLDDAYNISKRGRPAIYPNAGFFDQLLALDAKLFPGQRPLDILSMERDKVP